jgi:hypothetical protein
MGNGVKIGNAGENSPLAKCWWRVGTVMGLAVLWVGWGLFMDHGRPRWWGTHLLENVLFPVSFALALMAGRQAVQAMRRPNRNRASWAALLISILLICGTGWLAANEIRDVSRIISTGSPYYSPADR